MKKNFSDLVVNLGSIAESFIPEFEEYKQKYIEFTDIPSPTYHV
jgi:hypothetical protein